MFEKRRIEFAPVRVAFRIAAVVDVLDFFRPHLLRQGGNDNPGQTCIRDPINVNFPPWQNPQVVTLESVPQMRIRVARTKGVFNGEWNVTLHGLAGGPELPISRKSRPCSAATIDRDGRNWSTRRFGVIPANGGLCTGPSRRRVHTQGPLERL